MEDLQIGLLEIIKFFKYNYKKIILGTLSITIIIYGLFLFLTREYSITSSDTNPETSIVEEDETKSSDSLVIETDARPAHFYFYIEYEDGRPYTNSVLIEQFMLTPSVLSEASLVTDSEYQTIIEDSKNRITVKYDISTDYRMLQIKPDMNSNINELSINIGDESENLVIARYYYQLLIDKELPFLDGKELYIIRVPEIKDIENSNLLIEAPQEPRINTMQIVAFSLLIGLIIISVILFASSFFSKKLIYSFSYPIKDQDIFILIDKNTKNQILMELLLNKNNSQKVAVLGQYCPKNFIEEVLLNNENEGKDLLYVNSISEINNIKEIDYLIYFIEENITDRSWYNEQLISEKIYDIPKVIVQKNK